MQPLLIFLNSINQKKGSTKSRYVDPLVLEIDNWKIKLILYKFNQTLLLQETLTTDSNQ